MTEVREFQRMQRVGALALLAGVIGMGPSFGVSGGQANAQTADAVIESESGTIEPTFHSPNEVGAVYSAASARAYQKLLQLREAMDEEAAAAEAARGDLGLLGLPETEVEETTKQIGFDFDQEELDFDADQDAEPLTDAVTDLRIRLFRNNNVATTPPAFRSTLGEPAAVNAGRFMLYTGNTFASVTRNEGNTWTQRNFPPAPSGTPNICCDQDLEYSKGRNRTFWSKLYLNSGATQGKVTITVIGRPDTAPLCTYEIPYAGLPANTSRLPDYPHMALSNDFIYLSTNNIDRPSTGGAFWSGSQMWRIPLDAMGSCQKVSYRVFTMTGSFTGGAGQRVFVPANGATDVMYWGIHYATAGTSWRIFRWPETSNSIAVFTRTISTSPQTNPDCRGGVNNTDFIERSTSWTRTGFRVRGWVGQPPKGGDRGVVGWMWNSGPIGSIIQGHIRAAVFDVETLNLVSEPHIANNSYCFGYPDVTTTQRRHPGVVFAYGGRKGGGGLAVRNGLLLGDDAATGGGPFGNFVVANTGTHNPSNGRYGDYLTVHRHVPCDHMLTAATYVLRNGTSSSNVQHRLVQFGRSRDDRCWNTWHFR